MSRVRIIVNNSIAHSKFNKGIGIKLHLALLSNLFKKQVIYRIFLQDFFVSLSYALVNRHAFGEWHQYDLYLPSWCDNWDFLDCQK